VSKPLPASTDAEAAVVGGLLVRPQLISEVAPILTAEDFSQSRLGLVYQAILDIDAAGQLADVIAVNRKLLGTDVQPMAVRDLAADVAVPEATVQHAHTVADLSVARRMAIRLHQATDAALDQPEDPADLAATISGDLLDMTARRSTEARSIVGLIDTVVASMEGGATIGLPTGFRGLDHTLGGLLDGQLILIAARPGVGKTSFASAVARNIAGSSGPVAFFSYEMSAEEIATRLVCSEAGVSYHDLRAGRASLEDWRKLVEAVAVFTDSPLIVVDNPGGKLADVRAAARRVKDLKLIVVDYIQLMPATSKGNRQEQVGEISRGLKLLARELNVPVLACCQLNRGLEMRQDKRPKLPDLRESGALEQDADVVVLLHRDDGNPAHAELIIAKQRNGPTDTVKITFERQHTAFRDLGW